MRKAARIGWRLWVIATLLGCNDDAGGLQQSVDAQVDTDSCDLDAGPRCTAGTATSCVRDLSGRPRMRARDCAAEGRVCAPGLGCAACEPGALDCLGPDVIECAADGVTWEVQSTCDGSLGLGCGAGACRDLCELADAAPSHLGCAFVLTDLDNAVIDPDSLQGALAFGAALANPNPVSVDVEVTGILLGNPVLLASARIAPRDVEMLRLPDRLVDGSSRADRNDGTHTAVTPSALRIEASLPIGVTMFNPIAASASADASLVLPVAALDRAYVVTGWRQTIANSEVGDQDFDPASDAEDLRAFLTVAAVADGTRVEVELGPSATIALDGAAITAAAPGDTLQVELDAFDVLNLETAAFGAGFGGSRVRASQPVSVFTGAEAADIPSPSRLGERQCCADHLEAELVPDAHLGSSYVIASAPKRAALLNDALVDGYPELAASEEQDWVRIVAPDAVSVQTTLPPPLDAFELEGVEELVFPVTRDFVLEASGPVQVLQAVVSQDAAFIARSLPGGDPAIFTPAAIDQHVADYVFATPEAFPFSAVILSAKAGTEITLDGANARESCSVSPIEGDDGFEVYRCPLTHPEVDPDADLITPDPQQRLAHQVSATEPVAAWVYGFGKFSSYAYSAGMRFAP